MPIRLLYISAFILHTLIFGNNFFNTTSKENKIKFFTMNNKIKKKEKLSERVNDLLRLYYT